MMATRVTRWRGTLGLSLLFVCAAAVVAGAWRQQAGTSSGDSKWWMAEPIRFLQTNLSERDSTTDPKALVAAVADFGANTFLMNMGGIVAHYPTRVPFHYPSTFLPPGRDLFGDVVKEAHARRIRVVGRFDLSKTQKAAFDAHPEWYFKRSNGEPAIYNGLYSTCINGDYYRDHALKILEEALDRYEVDGLFFNMFGNPTADYSGVPMGPCRCDACQRRYRARYGRDVPATADADYRAFMNESSREVAATIAELIHRKRPRAAFLTYILDHTDGIMSESNTAVGRPLPLWPYSASDNVSRATGSEPDKIAINLDMSFVDYPWRYAHVAKPEIELRLYQNMAHGGPPAFVVSGTMDQQDRSGLLAAKPIFQWHARHEDLYVGQNNAARVLLLTTGDTPSYRGFFRILTEQHIPFAVSENLRWIEDRRRDFDLVIVPGRPPEALDRYVREGGRVLVSGTTPPSLPVGRVIGRKSTQGYWRIQDRTQLPSLRDTDLVFIDGEYVELAPPERPTLTLIPTAMFGPPEKVWADKVETMVPGLIVGQHEQGKFAYLPWDVGGLYYRHSSPAHAGLIADVIDRLLPNGRQLKSDAHPLVEITLMDQPSRKRMLIHLVNGTGHHDTAYFPPVELRNIRIDIPKDIRRAHAVSLNATLPVTSNGAYHSIVLPSLKAYEVIVVE
jgi:putative glycosyl hydrolase-like family 6 (GHL6) protein